MAPGTICPAVLLRQPPSPQSPVLPRPWGSGVQSLLVGVSKTPEHGEGNSVTRAGPEAVQ